LNIHGPDLITYRYKYGHADTTNCQDTLGYSAGVPALQPLVIDQTGLADGIYIVCVVGVSSDGVWQPIQTPTTAVWGIDRHGPAAFTINAPQATTAFGGAPHISWHGDPNESDVSYELALAGVRGDCRTPAFRLKVKTPEFQLPARFPGGKFTVCVTAFDKLGNATPAGNNGQITFERPVSLGIVYARGESPEGRMLVLANRTGTSGKWQQTLVPLPRQGARMSGRAALAVTNDGEARLAYQATLISELGLPETALEFARGTGSNLTHQEASAVKQPGSSGAQVALAVDGKGKTHIVHIVRQGATAQLVHVRGDNLTATTIETDDVSQGYQDLALASDAGDNLHLAYVRAGQLLYRSGDGSTWSAAQSLNTPDCTSIELATIATGPKGRRAIAFLCSRADQQGKGDCRLGVAAAGPGSPASWREVVAQTIDASAPCLPFNSNRPSLSFDSQGQIDLAYRYTSADHAGKWDIAAVTLDQNLAPKETPKALADWSDAGGFPHIALDASDRIQLVYLTGEGLRFAYGDKPEALHPESMSFANDISVKGSPLTVDDLTVAGFPGPSSLVEAGL